MQLIPDVSLRLLNLIGAESQYEPWYSDFYSRQIQTVVPVLIEQEFEQSNEYRRVCALQKWMEQSPNERATQENQLNRLLESFAGLCQMALPGGVTITFTDLNRLYAANRAFEHLVFLEVLFYIDRQIGTQRTLGGLDSSWKKLESWVKRKKAEHDPTRWRYYFKNLENKYLGQCLKEFFNFVGTLLPMFAKRYWSSLLKRIQTISHSKNLFNDIVFHLLHEVAKNILIFIVLSVVFIFNVAKVLSNILYVSFYAWEPRHRIIKKIHQALDTPFAWLVILTCFGLAAYYLGLLCIQFSIFSAALYGLSALTFGVLGAAYIKIYPDDQTDRLDDEQQFFHELVDNIEYYEVLVKSLMPVFELIGLGSLPYKISYYSRRLQDCLDEYREIFLEKHNASNLAKREECFAKLKEILKEVTDQIVNYNISDERFFEIRVEMFLSKLKAILDVQDEQMGQALSRESLDYNRMALIPKIMRLQSQYRTGLHEVSPELAEVLVQIKNPHTFLMKCRTLSELPSVLRPYAEPPAEPVMLSFSDDENASDNEYDAYVPSNSRVSMTYDSL